jgi:DNA repair protein RadC
VAEAKKAYRLKFRKGAQISSSVDAANFFQSQLTEKEKEIFVCLFLDTAHKIISYEEIFHGTINACRVYPREIAKLALGFNATAVIIAHNHPSGTLKESPHDIELTQKLQEALNLIEVKVLDHIIVGQGTKSLKDHCLF